MSAAGRWSDLGPRLGSAVVMVGVGVAAIWAGGPWFDAMILIASAVMGWELARLCGAGGMLAVLLGAALGAALYIGTRFAGVWPLAVPLLAVAVSAAVVPHRRQTWLLYGLLIAVGAVALIRFRAVPEIGLWVVVWLLAVVIASDVAGYFAGRLLGGPKFWPRISPKKTWSGTVAGWIGAAAVGLVFVIAGGSPMLILLSPLVALAAQFGDIAESAVKRQAGVKDASALIPGHGGLMDRFDALIGASAALFVLSALVNLPHPV